MNENAKRLIEKFLCPGCVCGMNVDCGHYKPGEGGDEKPGFECLGHVLGTVLMPGIGNIALGLPKGFNRPGYCPLCKRSPNQMPVRLWPAGTHPKWDDFNIPVWALEKDGFLFVRTACPRVAYYFVDVFEGGKASELCPRAIDMTSQYDSYD
jgi:hypothetical protein